MKRRGGAGGSPPAFDVLVLGGGPAGTAAGLTLLKRPGVSVAVLEASGYDGHRVGESLTPGARPLLEYLGVWKAFRDANPLDAFGSRAAWGRDEPGCLDYLFTLHGTGWSLDRVGFDRMLAGAFRERGGELFRRTRFTGAERTPDGAWLVRAEGPAGGTLRARYLVDATGRRALLARRLGVVREVHDRLVGVGGVAELPAGAEVESNVLVEACAYGWWYSAPVPGRRGRRRLAVVLMSDADLVSGRRAGRPAVWRDLLEGTVHTRARAAGARLPDSPAVFGAHTGRLLRAGGEGWVAAGDALVSHDPLSSTGIPHALGSGVHGALVAADALFGEGRMLAAFEQGVRADFFEYLTTHARHYAREARWPGETFWARRRIPVELDPRWTFVDPAVTGRVAEGGAGATLHLSERRTRDLLGRCRPGREVHEAARAFAEARPEVPHRQVILALQELVARGAVRVEAPAPDQGVKPWRSKRPVRSSLPGAAPSIT